MGQAGNVQCSGVPVPTALLHGQAECHGRRGHGIQEMQTCLHLLQVLSSTFQSLQDDGGAAAMSCLLVWQAGSQPVKAKVCGMPANAM